MAGNQKFCPSCGTPNPTEVVFCAACGNRFPVMNTQASAPTPPVMTPPGQQAAGMPPIPQPARSDFITLSCPNCGGRLQITPDIERFACQYCGYEHIVRRSGGMVSLEPVMRMMGQINSNINMVGSGVYRLSGSAEKQASESAIVRLKQEIEELKQKIAQANHDSSTVWTITISMLFGGGFCLFLGYVTAGYVRVIEVVGKVLGWIILPISVFLVFAAISTTSSTNKSVAKLTETIRQKQMELDRHYQVVSQTQNHY